MSKAFAAALLLAAVTATAARAQPASHLTLGAGIGFQNYRDTEFSTTNPAIVPEYHIGMSSHPHRNGVGWGLTGGISYYTPDRNQFIGDVETRTGRLQSLQLMLGAGPSYRNGPLQVGFGVVAGPSFNRMSVDDAARVAYRDRLGATLNSIKVENSVAGGPDLGLWYDLTSRLALHTSVGYEVNRPMVRTTVNGATSSRHWNMDSWTYQAGLGLGLF